MEPHELGMLIKKKRLEKKMKQTELAEFLHVSRTAISKWETGVNRPDLKNLTDISHLLDIPLLQLLGQEEIPDTADTAPIPNIPNQTINRKSLKMKISLAFGAETIVLTAALTALILLYINRPPVFTIIDNFHGTYEDMKCCCFIVESQGKFTENAWQDYIDTFRERYITCFDEVQAIVIFYFKDYNDTSDTFDSPDRIAIIYDYPPASIIHTN